jgi:hypothetical protein
MKTVPPKRPGRPATGRDPLVQLRMPRDVIQAVNRWASKFQNLRHSAAIRTLVELGLHAGRKKDHVFDPKGFRLHERKVPLAKRRRLVFDKGSAAAAAATCRRQGVMKCPPKLDH